MMCYFLNTNRTLASRFALAVGSAECTRSEVNLNKKMGEVLAISQRISNFAAAIIGVDWI